MFATVRLEPQENAVEKVQNLATTFISMWDIDTITNVYPLSSRFLKFSLVHV